MKSIYSNVVFFVIILTSCSDIKYIVKGNKFYNVRQVDRKHYLTILTAKRNFPAQIIEKENYVVIKTLSAVATNASIPIDLGDVSVPAYKMSNNYFPEVELDPSGSTADGLVYLDSKPVLQAMTIPLKIRPKIKDLALKDSFPSQVEAGFNFALAFGWKFNRNSYRAEKNILGQHTDRISVTPGLVLGAGSTDLKKSNTREPIIQFERKAPLISFGGFVMIGFNNLNIGYVLAIDNALGDGSKSWLYRNRVWHGIALGLDIIK